MSVRNVTTFLPQASIVSLKCGLSRLWRTALVTSTGEHAYGAERGETECRGEPGGARADDHVADAFFGPGW
jgi:hypothetical protein